MCLCLLERKKQLLITKWGCFSLLFLSFISLPFFVSVWRWACSRLRNCVIRASTPPAASAVSSVLQGRAWSSHVVRSRRCVSHALTVSTQSTHLIYNTVSTVIIISLVLSSLHAVIDLLADSVLLFSVLSKSLTISTSNPCFSIAYMKTYYITLHLPLYDLWWCGKTLDDI